MYSYVSTFFPTVDKFVGMLLSSPNRGVVIAFATSPVLLVVTSMTYGLATGVQKLCSDIEPPDYPVFREVADNPAVWGGVTLIGVLTRETYYTTVNISITKTLRY